MQPNGTDALFSTHFISYCRRRLKSEYLPKIERCLNELTDDDIWWRPHETGNSIGNLILHLCGNMRQWIISGLGEAPDVRERGKEFSETGPVGKYLLLEKLRSTVREADAVLEGFDTNRLLEVRQIQVFELTCLDALSHVVEHFAQHTGQIIYITKLRRRIDLRFYDL